jgi:hypothetical protein
LAEERSRAGGLSGSYLARIMPTAGLLGCGEERQGAAAEHLDLLLRCGIIAAVEVARARGTQEGTEQ